LIFKLKAIPLLLFLYFFFSVFIFFGIYSFIISMFFSGFIFFLLFVFISTKLQILTPKADFMSVSE
jgi:hypothetical protein